MRNNDKWVILLESIERRTIIGCDATSTNGTNHQSGTANGANGTRNVILGAGETRDTNTAQNHFGASAYFGRQDKAQIATKATNLANLATFFVTRATTTLGLGVNGQATRGTNAETVSRRLDAANGIVAITT